MKKLVKKIVVLVMTLAIVTSTINIPQDVKASGFYTITLNANGGRFSTIGSSSRTIKMPSSVGLKVTSYYSPDSRTGYNFLGWSTSKTATKAKYSVNAVLPKKTATYYAVWRSLATTGVKIDQSDLTIKYGTTQKLTATVLPTYASNKNVTWASSNTNVLKVESDGTITPVRLGTATVTVKTVSGGYTASIKVTIEQGVSVRNSVTANRGTKQTIKYSIKSTGTTENDKIVGYYFDGNYESITPTYATIIEKEVNAEGVYAFVAVTANGAQNYAGGTPLFNVTFNSNDGNNNTETCLLNYGAKPSILQTKNMFNREGYSLVGWSTDPNANQPDDMFIEGASKYYAVWYKVNISDNPNVISKDIIDVTRSYNPTQLYITVTAPDGSVVDYDTTWSIMDKYGYPYELKDGNLLYATNNACGDLRIKSSDELLKGSVKVNLIRNITVTYEKNIDEDGTYTVVYYAKFNESSLKKFKIDGIEYSASDVTSYDKSTNTYKIEKTMTGNGGITLEIIGEDNSYLYMTYNIQWYEDNYRMTIKSDLTDKNGKAAATLNLQCGKVKDNSKGYYFGTSENYKENKFYNLSESSKDNDIEIVDGYYSVNHYIRKAGTYYYTPVDAEGNKHATYEKTVYEVTLNANGGETLDQDKYYIFKDQEIKASKFPVPTNSSKNQIFRGWYLENEAVSTIKATSDLTLMAKWRTNPFKDKNGNDTGFSFSFSQFKFGFTNFGCTNSPNGHCKAIAILACRLVTAENDFNVSDFQKVGVNGAFTPVKSISEFTNITGIDTDTIYINSKTGITLNDYICGYQHPGKSIPKPSSTYCDSVKKVLEAVKNIKNTGTPVQVSVDGIVSTNSSVVSMGHALVAYDVKQVKATTNYTEYTLSIYDCNDNTKERTLSIWCNGDENSSDAKWGWKYVWSSTDILGSDYNQSKLSANIYDCNN